MKKRWVKIIDQAEELIGESAPLFFLDATTDFPSAVENDNTITGMDGVLPGSVTYAPFNLILRFGLDARNVDDMWLYDHDFRSVFSRRNPFTIIHSQLPGIKYAVSKCDINRNILEYNSIEYEVVCKVYKGYSESVVTTDEGFDFNHIWMVDSKEVLNFTPEYKHTTKNFIIWNGSTEKIDPRMHHQLKILLNITTTDYFELVNHTTGDIFKYNKPINSDQALVLDSVYAYRNKERCGIDTNRGVITLAPGINKFSLNGNIKNQKVLFKFPFIYR